MNNPKEQELADGVPTNKANNAFFLIKNVWQHGQMGTTINRHAEMVVRASEIEYLGKKFDGCFFVLRNSCWFVEEPEYRKILVWLSALHLLFR